MFHWYTGVIIIAYIISTLTFLFVRVFSKIFRRRTENFLNWANGLILAGLCANLFFIALSTIECSTIQNEMINNSKKEGYNIDYSSDCISILIWTLIFGFAFHMFFVIRKFRTKIWSTVISLFLLIVLTNIDKIIITVTSFLGDYLPSSWSFQKTNSEKLWIIAISAFYFLICWTIPSFKFIRRNQ